jgi:hypothetical protein
VAADAAQVTDDVGQQLDARARTRVTYEGVTEGTIRARGQNQSSVRERLDRSLVLSADGLLTAVPYNLAINLPLTGPFPGGSQCTPSYVSSSARRS